MGGYSQFALALVASGGKGMTVDHLIDAFRYFGFEDCGMDDGIDEKYDKIALYQDAGYWTHAARIVDNGIYHSKFGASYDGLHSRGDVLQAQYGNVAVVMRRLKTDACLTEERKGITPGVMHLNIHVKLMVNRTILSPIRVKLI